MNKTKHVSQSLNVDTNYIYFQTISVDISLCSVVNLVTYKCGLKIKHISATSKYLAGNVFSFVFFCHYSKWYATQMHQVCNAFFSWMYE